LRKSIPSGKGRGSYLKKKEGVERAPLWGKKAATKRRRKAGCGLTKPDITGEKRLGDGAWY